MMKYPLIPIILLPLFASACGKEAQNTTLFSNTELRMERIETVVATLEQCANGGSELRTYIDVNANGTRDEAESIISSFVVCSGANGKDGTDGSNGKDGVDGQNGVDGKDGVDGQNGSDGKDGADGKDGTDGQNGADGTDGKDGRPAYLVVYQTSNVAPSCANGGSTITFGLDTNENGVLDADDAQIQSIVVCNGVDGKDGEATVPANFSCKISVKTTASWKEGYNQEVTIQYFGDEISGWTVGFDLPNGHSLVNLWDASTTDQNGRITAKSFAYNGTVKNEGKVTFGFQAARSDAAFPNVSSYRLNGVACQ